MHSLKALASVAVLYSLGAIPSSEATAQVVGFARAADQMATRPASLYHQAKAKPAGSCGAYMYWKQGKCVDARNKK